MDEPLSSGWQVLHRRIAAGETLNEAEQKTYEADCHELDATERMDGSLEMLREMRAQIALAEAEQQHLRTQEAILDARITALEERLDERTRRLLGIGA